MPSSLSRHSRCPKCDTPLIAICRITNNRGVTAEFMHERTPGRVRRKRMCKVFYPAPLSARDERFTMNGKTV